MRSVFVFAAVLVTATSGEAQTVRLAAVTPEVNAAPAVTPSDGYIYQVDGRRDPFLSLLHTGTELPRPTVKREGLAGFTLNEISVRGILQSRTALVAMVQGPDNKTYLIHQGDKLADAVVKNVTADGLVVMQDVTDPLSTQKQREVRKVLRSLEGAK
jgi:Tfp pilus assembly protein PilP